MPATTRAAAPRPPWSWAAPIRKIRASCRTRWPAIRRCGRSSRKTWEAGVRGKLAAGRAGTPACSAPTNDDDILFVADNAAGFGYFRNVGKTRRQGVELGIDSRFGRCHAVGQLHIPGRDVPQRRDRERRGQQQRGRRRQHRNPFRRPHTPDPAPYVQGARGLAGHAGMVGGRLGVQAVSGSFARGNENGQHRRTALSSWAAAARPAMPCSISAAPTSDVPRLRFFVQVNNLFDRRYATASQLGATGLTAEGNFIARPFSASGDNSVSSLRPTPVNCRLRASASR
jgi:outer membrane receptor protein involved in Fe transport